MRNGRVCKSSRSEVLTESLRSISVLDLRVRALSRPRHTRRFLLLVRLQYKSSSFQVTYFPANGYFHRGRVTLIPISASHHDGRGSLRSPLEFEVVKVLGTENPTVPFESAGSFLGILHPSEANSGGIPFSLTGLGIVLDRRAHV